VIAFDRPGFGHSDRPHGLGWSARTQAELFRDAFAILGINCPIVLGHSWGAAVALALGLNHAEAVRGLVLLSGYYYPTVRADVLFSVPTAIPILGDLLRYSVSPLIGRAVLPLLLKGMFAPLPVPARFTKGFRRDMSVRPGQIRAESQDGAAMIPVALSMRHRYQELSMPIVIVAGTKDRVVKDSQAVRLHEQSPHSVLRRIPGVGHMVHYAVPDEVARAIEEVGKSSSMVRPATPASGSYATSSAA
jgi:pimeloyl-ACP methyl ester carboxylesterase